VNNELERLCKEAVKPGIKPVNYISFLSFTSYFHATFNSIERLNLRTVRLTRQSGRDFSSSRLNLIETPFEVPLFVSMANYHFQIPSLFFPPFSWVQFYLLASL
jgi:hypothetical protein